MSQFSNLSYDMDLGDQVNTESRIEVVDEDENDNISDEPIDSEVEKEFINSLDSSTLSLADMYIGQMQGTLRNYGNGAEGMPRHISSGEIYYEDMNAPPRYSRVREIDESDFEASIEQLIKIARENSKHIKILDRRVKLQLQELLSSTYDCSSMTEDLVNRVIGIERKQHHLETVINDMDVKLDAIIDKMEK